MKIGIDALGCDHGKSGFGAYLLSFISNLPSESEHQFELFGSEIDRYTYSQDREINYISIDIPENKKKQRRFHFHKINAFLKKNKYDVVIYPAAEKLLPRSFFTPGVAVVNSIISTYKHQHGYLKRPQILHRLGKVQHIIAATQFIKEDLVKNGINEKKITVIYNGIDHKLFFQSLEVDSDIVEVKPFAIKKPYFIYASRLINEDKKHIQLINAFETFKNKTGLPYRLVIAGEDENSYSKKVQQTAFESQYATDIFLTGYFPHNSFPQLYSGAEACVFPAINEGVGLPVLEAMACGVPVLCSDSGALREVGGDAPVYFNSDNVRDIADKLEIITSDEELKKSKILAGIVQSAKYNWIDTVNQTISCAVSIVR